MLYGTIAPNLIRKIIIGDLNGIPDKKIESCVLKKLYFFKSRSPALSTEHQLFIGVKLHFQQIKPGVFFPLKFNRENSPLHYTDEKVVLTSLIKSTFLLVYTIFIHSKYDKLTPCLPA